MQHECKPLGRTQRFEYSEERKTNRVREQRLVLGVDAILATHERFSYMRTHRVALLRSSDGGLCVTSIVPSAPDGAFGSTSLSPVTRPTGTADKSEVLNASPVQSRPHRDFS
jgi:hypothetical protein